MRFLKQKSLSRFSITDQTLFTNHFGRAVMNLTGGLRLPQGTTAQRPNTSLVRYPASGVTASTEFADGMIRYNTTLNELECRIAGVWETVKAAGAVSIIKETYGPGDSLDGVTGENIFGPLNTAYIPDYTASPDNIMVLVENVMQISVTNFTIVQNPIGTSSPTGYLGGAAYPTGWYLNFTDPVPDGKNVTVYYGYAN